MTNVFVGKLDVTVTEQQLAELFASREPVETITIVKDRDMGDPRGTALVEMTPATKAPGALLLHWMERCLTAVR